MFEHRYEDLAQDMLKTWLETLYVCSAYNDHIYLQADSTSEGGSKKCLPHILNLCGTIYLLHSSYILGNRLNLKLR